MRMNAVAKYDNRSEKSSYGNVLRAELSQPSTSGKLNMTTVVDYWLFLEKSRVEIDDPFEQHDTS